MLETLHLIVGWAAIGAFLLLTVGLAIDTIINN